jgi:hypothetical protein
MASPKTLQRVRNSVLYVKYKLLYVPSSVIVAFVRIPDYQPLLRYCPQSPNSGPHILPRQTPYERGSEFFTPAGAPTGAGRTVISAFIANEIARRGAP